MDVLIKRCKLTNSILSQTTHITKDEILFGDFDVLGWCNVKLNSKLMVKYIVFNSYSGGELRKMLKFDFIDTEDKYLRLRNPYGNLANQKIEYTEDELGKLLNKLIGLQKELDIKGQIYL